MSEQPKGKRAARTAGLRRQIEGEGQLGSKMAQVGLPSSLVCGLCDLGGGHPVFLLIGLVFGLWVI